MKKRYGILAAAAAAVMLASTPVQAEIKIGFIATLSGPTGALGQDMYDGFSLALSELDGKFGGQKVTLIREDDQMKPDLGVQIVQKLLEKDKVDLVAGVTFSNVMMAVAKPLADAGTIFVGANAGPAPLAGAQCNANFFFASFQNDSQAEVMGKYAADKGYKKVYLMAPNYQSGRDQIAGFKRFYKETVAGEVYTQVNQTDYSAEITQMKAAAPDALYVFYPGGMGVNFIKQLRLAGMLGKVPLLSVSTADGITLPALKDTALGVLTGSIWGPDLDNAANKAFVAAFEKKYRRIPSQYAAQAYDAAHLINSALVKTGGKTDDAAALREALKTADFASVRGSFRFGNNNFPVQDMRVFAVEKNARGQVSLKTIATPLPEFRDSNAAQCTLP